MVNKSNDDNLKYKNKIISEEYRITRKGETEMPFSGKYCNFFEDGIYLCVCCDTPLFNSKSKFNSKSGWPDFHSAIKNELLKFQDDFSSGHKQIEVKCNTCNAHLGHVFDDGPAPHHKRY